MDLKSQEVNSKSINAKNQPAVEVEDENVARETRLEKERKILTAYTFRKVNFINYNFSVYHARVIDLKYMYLE